MVISSKLSGILYFNLVLMLMSGAVFESSMLAVGKMQHSRPVSQQRTRSVLYILSVHCQSINQSGIFKVV